MFEIAEVVVWLLPFNPSGCSVMSLLLAPERGPSSLL